MKKDSNQFCIAMLILLVNFLFSCSKEMLPAPLPVYPVGTIHCQDDTTEIIEVINPATGKTWMDRNLGASRVAISSTDSLAFGDLYQWGRGSDGHQCRNSPTGRTLSSSDQPGHGDFIVNQIYPSDWRNPQHIQLWQWVNGVNNPCPSGFRLPRATELDLERMSWSSDDAAGAFASPLKLPQTGRRSAKHGHLTEVGTSGRYWSGTVGGLVSKNLIFVSAGTRVESNYRAEGLSVRCIKD